MWKEVVDKKRKEGGSVQEQEPHLSNSREALRIRRETLGLPLVTQESKCWH